STDYVTNGVFDSSKWTAKQATYNSSAIKTSVNAAIDSAAAGNGGVKGCSVIDEPFSTKWGPKGTLTKVAVDAMATYVKSIFPKMPVGVFHSYQEFEPNNSYHTLDFI